jgi:hypothetical protein
MTLETPSFLLKGIDPIILIAEYNDGFFSRLETTKTKLKLSNNNNTILAPKYGNTCEYPIFSIKDKNNCNIIIATTGHSDYEVFTKNGGELPMGGRCEHCKEDFTHLSVGYPIAYREILALTNDSDDPKNAVYRNLYIFWTEGKFCSFECALGYIKLILGKPWEFRDNNVIDSEKLLKLLYKFTYPKNDVLRPAQDPRLLKINGGSLTKEEWKSKQHVYFRTDRVFTFPAKVEYIQQNFINNVTLI